MERMRFAGLLVLASVAVAGPAAAETKFLAYDAADRVTQALTRGLTFEVERGFFGGIEVKRLFSTSARGSADLSRGGPDGVRRALPEGARETAVYAVPFEGDGRGLTRALCPGADQAWLVLGRVQPGRPLVAHGVGRWADGRFRHCVRLSYTYRGEWALPAPEVNSPPPGLPAELGG